MEEGLQNLDNILRGWQKSLMEAVNRYEKQEEE